MTYRARNGRLARVSVDSCGFIAHVLLSLCVYFVFVVWQGHSRTVNLLRLLSNPARENRSDRPYRHTHGFSLPGSRSRGSSLRQVWFLLLCGYDSTTAPITCDGETREREKERRERGARTASSCRKTCDPHKRRRESSIPKTTRQQQRSNYSKVSMRNRAMSQERRSLTHTQTDEATGGLVGTEWGCEEASSR
jgi:hypothetical protein